jgi:hypothetical protein
VPHSSSIPSPISPQTPKHSPNVHREKGEKKEKRRKTGKKISIGEDPSKVLPLTEEVRDFFSEKTYETIRSTVDNPPKPYTYTVHRVDHLVEGDPLTFYMLINQGGKQEVLSSESLEFLAVLRYLSKRLDDAKYTNAMPEEIKRVAKDKDKDDLALLKTVLVK